MKIFKNRKAQQLVEFLLVAPFIIIFLGILTEYAYALNCNMTLSQGLKDVTSTIYREIVPNISESAIRAYVRAELTEYLQNNNVPLPNANVLDVGYNISGSNAVFVASYNYTPAFTLPNIFFHILPERFTFMATSSVPAAFLSPNAYGNTTSSNQLDSIWNVSNDFSDLLSFNSSKRGILNLTQNPASGVNILFLVPKATPDTANSYYALYSWSGDLVDPNFLNLSDGYLYSCAASCSSTGSRLMDSYSGCQNIIFVHDADVNPTDLTKLKYYWVHTKAACVATNDPPCVTTSEPISSPNVDGILKRTMGMIVPPLNLSVGNYDNLPVASYNMSVSNVNSYVIDTVGSKVIVHDISENIDPMVNYLGPTNVAPSNDSTEFGT